jgi:8-amino-7-oxononanoate synthase
VTGNHPLYDTLERKIAALKGTEASLAFGSGYLANIGAIPALVGAGDLVLADELSHACMMSGARLSGARVITFRHNDVGALRGLLAEYRAAARHCLVLTEGVFSMDGDLAPLPDVIAAAREHDAWTMTDDAHGFGVIGEGRGSAAHWGVSPDVQMGTLSKAAGSYGGYVAASKPVIDLLINRARSLIYATGLPPAVAGASIAGIDIIASDAALCARPLALARDFAARLGLSEPQSAIVPLVVGSSESALSMSQLLELDGFLVTAIRPPTVPDGTARLRVTFTAAHSEDDVARLAEAVRAHVMPHFDACGR